MAARHVDPQPRPKKGPEAGEPGTRRSSSALFFARVGGLRGEDRCGAVSGGQRRGPRHGSIDALRRVPPCPQRQRLNSPRDFAWARRHTRRSVNAIVSAFAHPRWGPEPECPTLIFPAPTSCEATRSSRCTARPYRTRSRGLRPCSGADRRHFRRRRTRRPDDAQYCFLPAAMAAEPLPKTTASDSAVQGNLAMHGRFLCCLLSRSTSRASCPAH